MQRDVILPIAIPIGAALGAGIIIFLISRILIFWATFSRETTPFVALAIAMVILLGGSIIAGRVSHIVEE